MFDNDDLPIAEWVWHSFGTVSILLGDITSRFPLIMQPELLLDSEAAVICQVDFPVSTRNFFLETGSQPPLERLQTIRLAEKF